MLTLMIFRDLEDTRSLDESIENMERGSLASFGSGGTTDSESKQEHKVGGAFIVSRVVLDIGLKGIGSSSYRISR